MSFMNVDFAPYAEVVNLLCRWADSRNADNTKVDKAPEILALRQYDVQHISRAMSAILKSAEPDVRLHAIDTLPHLVSPDIWIDLLIPSLSDPSSGIRWTLCELFHGYPDSRVVLPLVRVLQEDTDPTVRLVAAEALYEVGDERALPALAYAEQHDKGRDYEDRTIAHAAREAILAILKEE